MPLDTFLSDLLAEFGTLLYDRLQNEVYPPERKHGAPRRVPAPKSPGKSSEPHTAKASGKKQASQGRSQTSPPPTMPGFSPLDTAWAVLGLAPTEDRAAVRKHYISLMNTEAVDRGGDKIRAAMINSAYQMVCQVRGWRK